MPTVRTVLERALAKSGGARSEVYGEEARDALFALNTMMHAWKLAGVDIQHSDVDHSDNFPLGDEFIEGTIYLLASRISPDYEIPPFFDADDWFRKFQAAYAEDEAIEINRGLRHMPSQLTRRKISNAS